MTFCGQVQEVRARYTMFSFSGRPVRSTVQLSIAQQMENSDLSYWNDAFNRCFGREGAAAESGGKPMGQQLGNLLNIGF
jgi:hypothetical protein